MKALVIGSGGQDGQLLSKSLLDKGIQVLGLTRNEFDFTDQKSIQNLVDQAHFIYYLPAHHTSSEGHSGPSASELEKSFHTHCMGLQAILQCLLVSSKNFELKSHSEMGADADTQAGVRARSEKRLFYAASSLVYGNQSGEFDENSLFSPSCIYGMTKAFGVELCRLYRDKYNLFACSGILFNHESKYRKAHFLSKKISTIVCRIRKGSAEKLTIGNLNAEVDWSHAEDFINAFQLILTATDKPADFVIGSGKLHRVQDFVATAFSVFDLDWRDHVISDSNIIQRTPPARKANPTKLIHELGWKPQHNFTSMVQDLVMSESARLESL